MKTISANRFIELLSGASLTPNESRTYEFHISQHNIIFKNVEVIGRIILKDVVIEKRIFIESGEYNFEFDNPEIKEWFNIQGGTFGFFKIVNPKVSGALSITGGLFKNVLEINGGIFENNFTIDGGEFQHGLRVTGGLFKKYFQLTGGHFKRWVDLKGMTVDSWLYVHRTDFEYGIQVHSCKIAVLNIWHCPGLKNVYLMGSILLGRMGIKSDQSLKVSCLDTMIDLVDLSDTTFQKDVNLYLHHCAVHSINMWGFYNFGYLSLTNLMSLEKQNFNDYQNKPRISIRNSNLGRADFIACDLSGFEIDFEDSRLNDIGVLGGKFNHELTFHDNVDDQTRSRQKRLFNGQLKKVFENRGDFIASSDAHTADLNAYLDSLSWNKNLFSSQNFEIVNLFFNKVSTNHGKSWRRGLLSLLVTGVLSYSIYLFALGFRFSCNKDSFKMFVTLGSYFFEFLSPIHKVDFLTQPMGLNSTNGSRIADSLSRVLIAYFVYQLIQAFRKHGKK